MTAKTATLRQLWQQVNHDDPHAFGVHRRGP